VIPLKNRIGFLAVRRSIPTTGMNQTVADTNVAVYVPARVVTELCGYRVPTTLWWRTGGRLQNAMTTSTSSSSGNAGGDHRRFPLLPRPIGVQCMRGWWSSRGGGDRIRSSPTPKSPPTTEHDHAGRSDDYGNENDPSC